MKYTPVKNFINGQFVQALAAGSLDVISQVDGSLLSKVPLSGTSELGTWNYAALWISMSLCIPTYMLASSLIQGGMNWWESILIIINRQ